LRLLVDVLTRAGFRVLVAEHGHSALELLKHARPNLILLDVMMPGIDGFETCRRLKADPHLHNIPVIFMTALSESVDEVRGLALGAVDYIIKPYQPETVLARINTHLTLMRLQSQLQERVQELESALETVKLLSGMLPICANCKNIRDDKGYWHQVEVYIRDHSEADFSHGLCPDCVRKLYPDLSEKLETRKQGILDVLDRLGQATLQDLATSVGLPESNTLNYLVDMVSEGELVQVVEQGRHLYKLPG
jgi:CheY-like chemotaxis protein